MVVGQYLNSGQGQGGVVVVQVSRAGDTPPHHPRQDGCKPTGRRGGNRFQILNDGQLETKQATRLAFREEVIYLTGP